MRVLRELEEEGLAEAKAPFRGRGILVKDRSVSGTTALLEVTEDFLYYREQHAPDLRAGARLSPLDGPPGGGPGRRKSGGFLASVNEGALPNGLGREHGNTPPSNQKPGCRPLADTWEPS